MTALTGVLGVGTTAAEDVAAAPITLESIAASVREIKERFGPLPEPEKPYTYRAGSLFIDSVEFGDDFKVSWDYVPKAMPLAPQILFGPETYEASFDAVLVGKRHAWNRFLRTLTRRQPPRRLQASFETLMRRASYGGRKGRRALRRLMAMGDDAWKEGLA